MLVVVSPNLPSIVMSPQKASFRTLDLCGSDVQSEIPSGDDMAVRGNGTHYVSMDVTGLLYGVAPGAILLKTPVSFAGVTFISPKLDAFSAIYSAGFHFVTVTFADGSEHNLSEIMFPPSFNVPGGCGELVTHDSLWAGFVLEFSPSAEPVPYSELGVQIACIKPQST
jgi:hypothetical protein